MLMPKRVKRRRVHRGRMKGKATRGNTITYGEYGLKAVEPAWITSNQIEAARIAMEVLEKMNLSDRKDAYPCELSGGQQQRIAIARALALNPKILFFDEPTSALDPELTGEILKVIRNLAMDNMTMVIVTHEMEFAREVADRVIFMDNGIIIEQGTPEEIFGNSVNQRTMDFLQKY